MLGHGASFTAAAAPSGALPGPVCRDTRASITRGSLRLDSPHGERGGDAGPSLLGTAVFRGDSGIFPLTPALSLRERGPEGSLCPLSQAAAAP